MLLGTGGSPAQPDIVSRLVAELLAVPSTLPPGLMGSVLVCGPECDSVFSPGTAGTSGTSACPPLYTVEASWWDRASSQYDSIATPLEEQPLGNTSLHFHSD